MDAPLWTNSHKKMNIAVLKKAATTKNTKMTCPADNTMISTPPMLGIPLPKIIIRCHIHKGASIKSAHWRHYFDYKLENLSLLATRSGDKCANPRKNVLL